MKEHDLLHKPENIAIPIRGRPGMKPNVHPETASFTFK